MDCLKSIYERVNYTCEVDFGSDNVELSYYDMILAGKRIQQSRKAKGYTQESLAELITMNPKNVSRLENGTMGLSLSTLVALSRVLEVSTDYILFGNDSAKLNNTATLLLSKLPEKKQIQAEKVLQAFVDAYEQ